MARVSRPLILLTACVGGLLSASLAHAQSAPPVPASQVSGADDVVRQIEALKQEIAALRQEYDARLAGLAQRLDELQRAQGGVAAAAAAPGIAEHAAAPAQAPPQAAPEPPAPAPPAPVEPPVATPAPPGIGSKVFNPDIAVIGNFLGATGTNPVNETPTFDLNEAEASFQAVIDPYARGDFYFAFNPSGVEIEEGFVTFLTLPADLLLRAGKMRAAFGKVNTMHTHALPWTDRPLVTDNLVGGDEGISDSGMSLSRLLNNPLFFLEAIGEVYYSNDEVFEASKRSALTYVGRLRGYRDLTEGTNLDVGTSIAYGPTAVGPDTHARLIGIDATFRYRPLRRAIYRRLLARTELVWSRQDTTGATQNAFGWYGSADYQFARRWFAGARYDYSQQALDASLADRGGSLLLTFWPSEFSQVRGQYRHTRYDGAGTANEFLFQFLFSIGAHGAHVF